MFRLLLLGDTNVDNGMTSTNLDFNIYNEAYNCAVAWTTQEYSGPRGLRAYLWDGQSWRYFDAQ